MPNWNEILVEIQKSQDPHPLDSIRVKYLKKLELMTGRNVIAYYSGWLQYPHPNCSINDNDKNAFMNTIYKLDKTKGLDLILHTPGGNVAATESIVDYLHTIFDNNIRVIVPQIAMSAGTMIACASSEIIMGNHSNLGPIDPQFNGKPTQSIIEEFELAKKEISEDPQNAFAWKPILQQYHPSFIVECYKANKWSEEIVKKWLTKCMFRNNPQNRSQKVQELVEKLIDHQEMKTHERHISKQKCIDIGLKIYDLEAKGEKDLQDTILSIHHSFMHTFSATSNIVKIVENQNGSRMIISA